MPARSRKSNLYTGTGDLGETGLFGGRRVRKDNARVNAYGTIDELNAALGVAASLIKNRALVATLQSIQNELFNIGAELASDQPVRRKAKSSATFQLGEKSIRRLEQLVDDYDARVAPLKTFILPGGSQAASAMHFARTVARRAEREVVTLAGKETINPAIVVYLNRLCDLLFALARYANKAGRKREITWQKDS
jgi:cob(I)alamin adenosyltransferase